MPKEPQNNCFKRNISKGIQFSETTINICEGGKGKPPGSAGVMPGRGSVPQSRWDRDFGEELMLFLFSRNGLGTTAPLLMPSYPSATTLNRLWKRSYPR